MPRNDDWPRFERAAISGLSAVPERVRHELASVPRTFVGRYRALPEVEVVDVPGAGPLIRFGMSAVFGPIHVDAATGRVLAGDVEPGEELGFVNSSLPKFTETVRGLLDQFPFYGESDDDARVAAAASRASELIAGIDPPAAAPDTFWGTFVDDLANGDFTTEDVLEDPD